MFRHGSIALIHRVVLFLLYVPHLLPASADDTSKEDKTCAVDDETCKASQVSSGDSGSEDECTLYLAQSSIPNAGLGMFLGKDTARGETIGHGDIVLPLIDIEESWPGDYFFLWDEYVWEGSALNMEHESDEDVHGCSPGFGAAANSFLSLVNVDEHTPRRDDAGIHRSVDPGAGAFSLLYDRTTTAKRDLLAGSELFVSYGENWFTTRESNFGLVPLTGDLNRSNRVVKQLEELLKRHDLSDSVKQEVWGIVTDFGYKSRVLNALPKGFDDAIVASKLGVQELTEQKFRRTKEWLKENGSCMDNLRVGLSTLPHAGRGAFATRFILENQLIAPAPLIHIPYRKYLDLYDVVNGVKNVSKRIIGHQLLLNYCFGHSQSTMLLSPYGTGTNYINHHAERANAKIVWSNPKNSNHNPEWLNLTVDNLEAFKYAGLSFDYMATRTIWPGEEVFIDYGQEWVAAWQKHVEEWKPLEGSEDYVASPELNARTEPLRTMGEQKTSPYPSNIGLECNDHYRYGRSGVNWKIWHAIPERLAKAKEGDMYDCDIIDREVDEDGRVLYTAAIHEDALEDDEDDKAKIEDRRVKMGEEKYFMVGGHNVSFATLLYKVPRDAFSFYDKPHTSDFHLKNAFRHEMMIPDEIFPDAWKNKVQK